MRILLLVLFMAGCATQSQYKSHVPETEVKVVKAKRSFR